MHRAPPAMTAHATFGTDVAPHPSRRGKRRRILFVVLGLIVVVGLLGAIKGAQIATILGAVKQSTAAGPPPEAVGSFVAEKQTWNDTLDAVGSVTSARGVSVSNESPGVVSKILFESGATARVGQVLVQLDTNVEQAQLASARARLKLAQTTAARTRSLLASGAIAAVQGETDETQLASAAADMAAIEAQIARKVVRAPFAGKLGIRLVNVGQYLAPGTRITVLESEQSSFVDFTLPQRFLGQAAVGMPVRYTTEKSGDDSAAPSQAVEGEAAEGKAAEEKAAEEASERKAEEEKVAEGKVYAVEPALDPTTRNIKLRATIPESGKLRPGMFVKVSVVQPKTTTVIAIPSTAIVHAPYGDSVFIIEDEKPTAGSAPKAPGEKPAKMVREQFVKLGQTRGDFVAIAKGVEAGQKVVSAGAFKLRNRSRVVVGDAAEIRPPELAPHPENR